jgi:nucleotide-binding universal stress UspA family protein
MSPKISHILYASDLSENSAPALAWAMMLSHQHDARITFLHVAEELSAQMTTIVRSIMGEEKLKAASDQWQSDVDAQIEARIRNFCEDTAGDMGVCALGAQDIVVTRGIPVERILREAEARKCDLIVMGNRGTGLLKDAAIGDTARRVVRRSKIPVVVIPQPQGASHKRPKG